MQHTQKRFFLKGIVFFVLLGVFALFIFYVSNRAKHPICKDCNVILISLDTLSANHLPCYGYDRNTAPNLCKFGEENILFENAFSNASWTLPSHVSLFTGLYPSQHKMIDWNNKQNLPRSVPFLPEILQNNGYKTYFYMLVGDPTLPIDLVYYRGINEITNTSKESDWSKGLQHLRSNNNVGQKTFLFLHTYWVHDPYIPTTDKESAYVKDLNNSSYLKIYKEHYFSGTNKCSSGFLVYLKKALEEDMETILKNDTAVYKPMLSMLSDKNRSKQFCNTYEDSDYLTLYYRGYTRSMVNTGGPKMMSHLKDLYDSKIVELDEYLKEVFAYVQNSELKKNTIIIITSDHGEEFGEHGSWAHGTNLFDTSIKVPLIMYVPGLKNKKIAQVAESVDVVPTLLSLLNIKNSYTFAGSDLLMNTLFRTTKCAISQEQRENSGVIRNSEWKLFYKIENNKAIGVKLFNYKKDSQEKNNVIFENDAIVEKLLKNIPK